MLAAQAPDLHEALQEVAEQGWSHVVVDGKLIRTDRCAETTTSIKGETINAWYSGKHRAPGGNVRGSRTWHTLLTSGDLRSRWSGMIAAVSLRLLYLIFLQVLEAGPAAGPLALRQGRRAAGAAA